MKKKATKKKRSWVMWAVMVKADSKSDWMIYIIHDDDYYAREMAKDYKTGRNGWEHWFDAKVKKVRVTEC